jgi:hypothetical protein
MLGANSNDSNTVVITSTGTKGFLTWMKHYLPDMYAYVSPRLVSVVQSQGLSGFGSLGCPQNRRLGRLGRLGQDDSSNTYDSISNSILTAQTSDLLSVANPADTLDISSIANVNIPSVDAASAASSAAPTNAITSAINSLVGAYNATAITNANISANNTLLQTNLARAQQGLPPLTTAVNPSTGLLSTIGTSLGSSGILIIGIIILAVAMGGKKSSAT